MNVTVFTKQLLNALRSAPPGCPLSAIDCDGERLWLCHAPEFAPLKWKATDGRPPLTARQLLDVVDPRDMHPARAILARKDAKKLLAILARRKASEATLAVEGDPAVLRIAEGSFGTVAVGDAATVYTFTFGPEPEKGEPRGKLSAKELAAAARWVSPAVSTNPNSKYEFAGVHAMFGADGCALAASDGYRLHWATIPPSLGGPGGPQTPFGGFPAEGVLTLRLADAAAWLEGEAELTVERTFKERGLRLSGPGSSCWIADAEGKYPQWNRVVPQPGALAPWLTLPDPGALLDVAEYLARREAPTMDLYVEGGKLYADAPACFGNLRDVFAPFPVKGAGGGPLEDQRARWRPAHLWDFLKCLHEARAHDVELELKPPANPAANGWPSLCACRFRAGGGERGFVSTLVTNFGEGKKPAPEKPERPKAVYIDKKALPAPQKGKKGKKGKAPKAA